MSSDATPFKWEDPFDFEGQLTEDERSIRDTAHDFAQAKLAPRIVAAYEKETIDPAIFREMGALGLLGLTLPDK
ncbi:MAG: acyl-CoA dehydrogenase family protein, partial [Roseiarcus sp.]